MACITLVAQPVAIATTQLTHAVRYELSIPQRKQTIGRKPLRMNWVVVTGTGGNRSLRMQWAADEH